MYLLYTFLLTLGFFFALPYYLLRFRKYMPTAVDRLGFIHVPPLERAMWIHAVSVGEVRAVEKLIVRLRQECPGHSIVVSTVTPAGQQLARNRRDLIDATFYFPFDWKHSVRRVLDRARPEIVIIAETEIWPNFLRACRRRGIPVILINGRISDKSYRNYLWIRHWMRRILDDYTVIGMQSDMDRQRIEALGADPRKVVAFGNLKYDTDESAHALDARLKEFLRSWRPLWIAASTMPGEEPLVLDAFRKILKEYGPLKMMIAPRHPERFDSVEGILKSAGWSYVRRTKLDRDAEILLLDSIGELAAVFEYASVVFMGGSLVSCGGHNILEPARFRKPIVFGPHMENFRDMASSFLEANAAVQVQNARQLPAAIQRILSSSEAAEALGRNAHTLIETNRGATDRVAAFLREHILKHTPAREAVR